MPTDRSTASSPRCLVRQCQCPQGLHVGGVGMLKQPTNRSTSARIHNGFVLLIVTLLVSACASYKPNTNPENSQAVSSAIKVQRDSFEKITSYIGPNASDFPNSVFIRVRKPDEGRTSYQIYVRDQYEGDWRYYDSAHDQDGTGLDTTVIDRQVVTCNRGCVLWEHLGINVSRAYLENFQERGIRFKISGKRGQNIYFIPPAYISAVLSAVK